MEQEVLFLGVFNIGVNQQRVYLRVDVLDGDLETVKAAGLGNLDFTHEIEHEVLVYDAVAGGKKRQHVFDKVALVIGEFVVPVGLVLHEVNLFGSPERCLGFFVPFPHFRVLDRQQNEAVGVLRQNRLYGWCFFDHFVLQKFRFV